MNSKATHRVFPRYERSLISHEPLEHARAALARSSATRRGKADSRRGRAGSYARRPLRRRNNAELVPMLNDFSIGKLEEMDVFESNSLARCSTWPRSHLQKQCFESLPLGQESGQKDSPERVCGTSLLGCAVGGTAGDTVKLGSPCRSPARGARQRI